MKTAVVYIHGAGGNAEEAVHYERLFPESTVIGFDYRSQTPWEAISEFCSYFDSMKSVYDSIILIANSIGAFFAMHSLNLTHIAKAYFISPIVDMEALITDMMQWAGVTEKELMEKGTIATSFGEDLSWTYLSWVRNHPIAWNIPTSILYGRKDHLQSANTINLFAEKTGAELTIMEDGEHWFHTAEQMTFLDSWISKQAWVGR